jgi:hypothetical protein
MGKASIYRGLNLLVAKADSGQILAYTDKK